MLTPYDEFPVHQAPTPFSQVPSTDYAWDDGYFFSAYSAEQKVIMFSGMRVSPNTDMIGGYAGINVDGQQYTVRFSREWRPNFDTAIGPLRYDFVRPMQQILVSLAPNESELSFELDWRALAAPHEEAHHWAQNRMRRTTDQTRYTQVGQVLGSIGFRGKTYDLSASDWYGTRDHSWGLYGGRDPLQPDKRWLPPPDAPARRRSLRFWLPFQTREYTGFYHFHEDEEGRQGDLNDVFGTPFEGRVDYRDGRPPLIFKSATHALEFVPGTRQPSRGVIKLVDEQDRPWTHEFETAFPPFLSHTIGYGAGSWKDGGSLFTYHGPGLNVEWDEFDVSKPPFELYDYLDRRLPSNGAQMVTRLRSTGPDGVVEGQAYLEFFVAGRYRPYGFE